MRLNALSMAIHSGASDKPDDTSDDPRTPPLSWTCFDRPIDALDLRFVLEVPLEVDFRGCRMGRQCMVEDRKTMMRKEGCREAR